MGEFLQFRGWGLGLDGAALADGDLVTAQTAAIQRVLTEITAAEDRLTGGTYGTCQGCKTHIPIERLEILPYVRYCVSCQQRATVLAAVTLVKSS